MRLVTHSQRTLVVEEAGVREIYHIDQAEDMNRLFAQLGFPGAHVRAGIKAHSDQGTLRVLLHRVYEQKMPGTGLRSQLVWCLELRADQEASEPVVLTPQEANLKLGIR